MLAGLLALALAAPVPGDEPVEVESGGWTLGSPPVTLDERVWAMKFSPDGGSLHAATDRRIHRIEWPSKRPRVVWQTGEGATMDRAVFSPDGSQFARLENGPRIHLHDGSTGKLRHSLTGSAPRAFDAAAWSGDGEFIAIGGLAEILIHRTATGELSKRIPQGRTEIIALAWSPDGKWIAAAHANGTMREKSILLHDFLGQTPPVPLPGNGLRRGDVKFSFTPDSRTLAVLCTEGVHGESYIEVLSFRDLATGKILYHRKGTGFNAITHSPDGKLFAASGLNLLEIRDARTGQEVFTHRSGARNSHFWSVAFSPDGGALALGVQDRIRFFETATWQEIDPDDELRSPVTALAFSADGRHLATGGENGDLLLWDWEKKIPVWKQPATAPTSPISALSIDPSSRWIGVVQRPFQSQMPASLVDFATGKTRRNLPVGATTDVAPLFHRKRPTAFIATRDHALVEWDCENERALRTIPVSALRAAEAGRFHFLDHLEFDPAEPELIRWAALQVAGRMDARSGMESDFLDSGRLNRDADPIPPRGHDFTHLGSQVWNLPSPFHVKRDGEHSDPAAKHPSELLLFIGRGTEVQVFDLLSQSVIHRFQLGPGVISALALSPDGRTLVAATTGGLHYRSLLPERVAAGTTFEKLWQLMGSDRHWQAYQAAWALARRPDFLPFLEKQLPPAREPVPAEIELLKSLLADGNPEVRQTAARKWLDLGLPLERETYETLRTGGLPDALPLEAIAPGFHHGINNDRPDSPIPPLVPLSDHRRVLRGVMLLREDRSAASLDQLRHLAAGHSAAPLTGAAARALAARSN